MSIYTTLPEDDPILSPQKRAAIAKKQQRAFLFSVMEKVKGFVIPVKPHQSPIPAVEQAVTVRNSPNRGCGYFAPMLGQCVCGDPKNHEPGGKFYIEGRRPGAYSREAVVSPEPGKWGRCSMCQGIGLHMADCPTVGVTPR